MAEKRRASTRGSRAEAPPKKKHQTTARVSSPREPSLPVTEAVEPLPSRITENGPLPTIARDQAWPVHVAQSIAQSGVLAAALLRSRAAWLSDGFFERYWTKPTKRKAQAETSNNPPKESMAKIGQCRVTIEPHVFETVLYAIRKWPPEAALPVSSTPKITGQALGSFTAPVPKMGTNPQMINSAASTPSFPKPPLLAPAPFSTIPSPSPNPMNLQPQTAAPPPAQFPPTTFVNQTLTSSQTHGQATIPSALPAGPPIQQKPSQDPVIQMLAQRASTNSELKALMKIVASGSATPEQLRVFQNHIDDLTAIIHRQKQSNIMTPIAPAIFSGPTTSKSGSGLPSLFRPGMSHMTFGQPSTYHPTPPAKPKPVVQPKSDITGVCMEFTGMSTDRYLFPKNCIVEVSPNGKHLVASFIVIRKKSGEADGKHDETKEYYQPVTIRLDSEPPRLEAISKTVNPPDQVRKYMEDIFTSKPRAEDVKLVLQLPSDDTDATTGDIQTLQGAVAARRHSLLTSPMVPGSGSGMPKSGRRKSEEADHQCRFCFALLSASQAKSSEQPVCDECSGLASGQNLLKAGGHRALTPNLPLRHSSGPRTLTMFGEAF